MNSDCYAGTRQFYRDDRTCVKDYKGTSTATLCGCVVNESWVKLHVSLESCYSAEFGWMKKRNCTSLANDAVSDMHWPDKGNSKCVKYSEMDATDLSVQLFDSAQKCCEAAITWSDLPVCISKSTGVDA